MVFALFELFFRCIVVGIFDVNVKCTPTSAERRAQRVYIGNFVPYVSIEICTLESNSPSLKHR